MELPSVTPPAVSSISLVVGTAQGVLGSGDNQRDIRASQSKVPTVSADRVARPIWYEVDLERHADRHHAVGWLITEGR